MDGLWRFDLDLFRQIHIGWHSPILDPVFWFFSYSGLGVSETVAILLLLLRRDLRAYVIPLLAALIVSGFIIADGMKPIFARDRPSLLTWAVPQEAFHYNSFPSGHTTSAFGIAFMLLFLTRGTPRRHWGWFAIVWASLVGVSRVYRGVHWPTDVIGGALFGLAGACLCYLVFSGMGWLPREELVEKEPIPSS